MKLSPLIAGYLLCSFVSAVAVGQDPPEGRNLVLNGGFEEDNDNLRGEKMGCPVRQRVTYGQRDGMPDQWTFNAQHVARTAEAHSGSFGLRIAPGNQAPVMANVIPCAVQFKGQRLPTLHFSAWLKGGVKDVLEATVALSVRESDAKTKQDVSAVFHIVKKIFPATAQWSKAAFAITPEEIAAALKMRTQPVGLITAALTLQGTANTQGITIDDVELRAPEVGAPYTLVPNAGFETPGKNGAPAEWSPAKKSLRYFGSNYYVWRDWYHFMGEPRGENGMSTAVAHSGQRSFYMQVPPGDDKHIESAAIPLKQTAPQKMAVQFEYNSYLLANLMVQVVDENGGEVFGQNITPGSTAGWQSFRAEFLPRRAGQKPGSASGGGDLYGPQGDPVPLKSCRIRIGAKGVNGTSMDDINEWINVNHGGALWIDQVVLAETGSTPQDLTARGLKTYPLDPRNGGLTVEGVDLGERLHGENSATVTLVNRGAGPMEGNLILGLQGPVKQSDPKKAGHVRGAFEPEKLTGEGEPADYMPLGSRKVAVPYRVAAQGRATVALPYSISQLLKDWRAEYRLSVSLDKDRTIEIPLGTWSQQALVEVEKCYPFAEDKTQTVFMNIGVAKKTLDTVDRLHLEVRRARDDQKVLDKDIGNFQQAAANLNAPLPEGFEGDSTNFYRTEVPLDKLPVHPQTQPVRDHYVHVAGLDKAGKVVFEGRSPRFGRMEAHAEKLDPIKEVKIHPDNYLLINGKPFFSRGHIWMQQNYGPAPFARQNTEWKKYGFNNRAGVQSPMVETDAKEPKFAPGLNELWTVHNTYMGSQMIAPKGPLTPAIQADIAKWLGKPNVIGIHYVPWEGSPQGTPDEAVQYAQAVKGAIGTRPLWVSAGWYAPAVNGQLDSWKAVLHHDWFMPENNAYFQPSQLDKEIVPLKRGKPYVLGTYPNVFNDTPYMVQRFEHWTEIIRGHTGYMQIGKPGDPTLMAGMNGEFRFIESFLFNKDQTPKVSVDPPVENLVRGSAKATYVMATNAGPVIGGDWEWNTKLKDKGLASHTGSALWNRFHDYMKDYHSHWYKDDRPVTVAKGDKIVQYVYLPADAKVENLILMVRGNGMWRHHAVWGQFNHQAFTDTGVRLWLAKDMHQMGWGSINLGFCGPQGHDPKNPELLKAVFTAAQFRNLGALPKTGEWVRLEIPVEQLGLDGHVVDGFGFVSKGGKVWWERTLLMKNGQEQVLCDGSAGIHPMKLEKVRFTVPGLKAGTKVKVCFEERDIVAGDGFFEDDLTGEEGYRNQWVGLYGDKIGETGYYGDGTFYNYNLGKVAARVYEVPK